MNKADKLFEMLQAAYLRGANWLKENGSDEGLKKAAYDYADYHTSPLTIAERSARIMSAIEPAAVKSWGEMQAEDCVLSIGSKRTCGHGTLGCVNHHAPPLPIEPAGVGVETTPPSSHVAAPDFEAWAKKWHQTCETMCVLLGINGTGSPDEILAELQTKLAPPSPSQHVVPNALDAEPDGWICEDEFTLEADQYDEWVAEGLEPRPFFFAPPLATTEGKEG